MHGRDNVIAVVTGGVESRSGNRLGKNVVPLQPEHMAADGQVGEVFFVFRDPGEVVVMTYGKFDAVFRTGTHR